MCRRIVAAGCCFFLPCPREFERGVGYGAVVLAARAVETAPFGRPGVGEPRAEPFELRAVELAHGLMGLALRGAVRRVEDAPVHSVALGQTTAEGPGPGGCSALGRAGFRRRFAPRGLFGGRGGSGALRNSIRALATVV